MYYQDLANKDVNAIDPAASVSGLYMAHPDSKYFQLGEICQDQIQDYSKRKGWNVDTTKRWLRSNLESN